MFACTFTEYSRVAEVGSVKASAKMAVCVRYCQIANLIHYDMQYIPCNSALLAQKTLFLTQKGTFLPKDLQKVSKSRQILIRDKIAYVRA